METVKRFMNVDELAAYLGISRNTIYWWVAIRKVPHNKLGKLVRFNRDEVDMWLKSNSREIKSTVGPAQ